MSLIKEILHIFLEAAPYLLLGLLFSAIIQSLVPKEKITRWIGQNNFRSVLIAAVTGVPLPLCSCGVIPMAISLRKNGASKGATAAFLISTPEIGTDSIMLSFALLDPIMAVLRPVAAFITALIAGLLVNALDRSENSSEHVHEHKDCCSVKETPVALSWAERLKAGFYNSFVVLLGDIAPWLIAGIALSGIISFLVPASVIEKFLGGGISSMLFILAISMPLYICASASTPIAASLLAKGASPGSVLVFLLAGPATNVTTFLMVYRFLGKKVLIIYLSTIAVCTLSFGLLLNWIYQSQGINVSVLAAAHQHGHGQGVMSVAAAVVLAALIIIALARNIRK